MKYVKIESNTYKKIIAVISAICLAVFFFWLGSSSEQFLDLFKAKKTGALNVTVTDGMTNEPIDSAIVVVPELDKSFTTNNFGQTAPIEAPIIPDAQYEKLFPKPWGEITLIVFKDGYMPYVLFNASVVENQSRQGPKILLFKEGSTESNQPFSIVEAPNRIWVNELIKKYCQ